MDDSDFDDDDDYGDAPASAEEEKFYETPAAVLSWTDIRRSIAADSATVAGVLGMTPAKAISLLAHYKWNKERLLETFLDDEARLAKISTSTRAARPMTCDICCDERADSLALSCGHSYCADCYGTYLTMKIADEGESRNIQCPADGCKLYVDDDTIKSVVTSAVYDKYQNLLTRTFVDDNAKLRWCPAPNCEYVVEAHIARFSAREIVPTVRCRCGNDFCFACGLPDHQPCICPLTKLWAKKCKDDSETANWISANTKECVKCNATIEKNGGCNHMTCRKCKYEFCWVCLGPWSDHGSAWYNCNRYEEKNSVDARDSQAKSRQALERYLHYYNRYANHEQSAKLTKELHEKTEKKMDEIQKNSPLSWIEVQFLKDAVKVLVKCRMTLKWTYAMAYYLARNNVTALFEDNQRDLEMAVETLTELLEQPIDTAKIAELKQKVLDKTVYVENRREILLNDTCRGLREARWEYNIDIKA